MFIDLFVFDMFNSEIDELDWSLMNGDLRGDGINSEKLRKPPPGMAFLMNTDKTCRRE
jgi:hypothetical protein